MIEFLETCNHEVKVNAIIWKTAPTNTYKLNRYGSSLNNPGKIGGGVFLRNEYGDIIYAFAIPFRAGTNNQAKIQAATYG